MTCCESGWVSIDDDDMGWRRYPCRECSRRSGGRISESPDGLPGSGPAGDSEHHPMRPEVPTVDSSRKIEPRHQVVT